MTSPTAPLAQRPRRSKVQRPPTHNAAQRAASRALRKSTPSSGTVSWTQAGLPNPPVAKAGVPFAESAMSLAIVVLLFVPVAVVSGFALGAFLAAGVAVLVTSYLLWARRVVVGERYVAVRQVGRYHIADLDHVRHLQLAPSRKGGVLRLHTDDGRMMRLRRVEVTRPEINAALRAWSGIGQGTHDRHVAELLDLPHDEHRLRHRYLADAVQ